MKTDTEIYNKLSVPNNDDKNQKWNFFLIACCMVASLASFSFGYNIGVTNLPTQLVQDFYAKRYGAQYYSGKQQLNEAKANFAVKKTMYEAGETKYNDSLVKYNGLVQLNNAAKSNDEAKKMLQGALNMTEVNENMINAILQKSQQELDASRIKLDAANSSLTNGSMTIQAKENALNEGKKKLDKLNTLLWTITNVLFVIGGVIGAFTSKYVAEGFGRKNSIVFHYIFGVIAGILTIIAPYVKSPECIMIGRFLFGLQGGMTCGLIPGYLNEISPKKLRGATGVMQQLFITMGILISQLLGLRQILGKPDTWHILLSLSSFTSILGGILLLVFFPDSPSSLINKNHDEDAARKALQKLRQSKNIENEIESIRAENRESKTDRSVSISELFTTPELKWPLITSIVLQLTQQLCGINAVFFYSTKIFEKANIAGEAIQYAILSTGVINVLATFIALPLIDRLGRKPLLVYPLLFIIVDFIALTFFLIFKSSSLVFSYLSIVCIGLFIVCFAVGLGPIPFVYVAEVFRAEARSSALAVSMFTNWMANLVLTLGFQYMADLLQDYTFLVFVVIVAVAVTVIIVKVPETKGRTVDEIMAEMDPSAARYLEESSGKLMSNTNI